jgi:hypothetical protein
LKKFPLRSRVRIKSCSHNLVPDGALGKIVKSEWEGGYGVAVFPLGSKLVVWVATANLKKV